MGKNKNKRKRFGDAPAPPQKMPHVHDAMQSSQSSQPTTSIDLTAADVQTTIDTLQYLTAHPEVYASKALRELRAALHPLVEEQLKKYDPVDYAARVTTAFRLGKGADALLAPWYSSFQAGPKLAVYASGGLVCAATRLDFASDAAADGKLMCARANEPVVSLASLAISISGSCVIATYSPWRFRL